MVPEVDELGRSRACQEKWEFIAELMTALKGPNNNNRLAVFQFDDERVVSVTDLSDEDFNAFGPMFNTPASIDRYFHFLLKKTCNGANPNDADSMLSSALARAYQQFADYGSDDSVPPRNKKIILINNCVIDDTTQICNIHYNIMKTGGINEALQVRSNKDKNGIDAVIVNLPLSPDTDFPDDYLSCLAEYDTSRIFESQGIYLDQTEGLIPYITDEICSSPSPSTN